MIDGGNSTGKTNFCPNFLGFVFPRSLKEISLFQARRADVV